MNDFPIFTKKAQIVVIYVVYFLWFTVFTLRTTSIVISKLWLLLLEVKLATIHWWFIIFHFITNLYLRLFKHRLICWETSAVASMLKALFEANTWNTNVSHTLRFMRNFWVPTSLVVSGHVNLHIWIVIGYSGIKPSGIPSTIIHKSWWNLFRCLRATRSACIYNNLGWFSLQVAILISLLILNDNEIKEVAWYSLFTFRILSHNWIMKFLDTIYVWSTATALTHVIWFHVCILEQLLIFNHYLRVILMIWALKYYLTFFWSFKVNYSVCPCYTMLAEYSCCTRVIKTLVHYITFFINSLFWCWLSPFRYS